jgi:hypothetical protein
MSYNYYLVLYIKKYYLEISDLFIIFVIVEGVNMWDKEIPQKEDLSTGLSKLQYILSKFGIVGK